MKIRCFSALFGLGVLLGFQGCSRGEDESGPAGSSATLGFELPDLSGKIVRLSDLKGKVVLLDFWATWCGPCEESLPFLAGLYERHRSGGFEVLGVSEDASAELVRAYASARRMSYPLLLDQGNRAMDLYGVRGVPSTFLLDREGAVRASWIGFGDDIAKDMEASVTALLGGNK